MLSPFNFTKRIPKWVVSKATVSSISSTNSIEISRDFDQDVVKSTDFEEKIQSLSNKLCPDNLIKVLCSTSDINSAVTIFKWAGLQKQFVHTADTYYWMILKLGMSGNVKELQGFCQNMIKDGCPGVEHVLISLVRLFVEHCRLNEAICVLVSMNLGGFRPEVGLFNSVLGALVEQRRDFRDVVLVYKEMVKAGIAPTVITLNFLLEILFETGRVEYALDQYKRLNKKGCSPNSRTFEIVIRGLIGKNRVDESIIVLNKMLELGCLPEFSFYTFLIPLFCRQNKLEEGIKLYRMMRSSGFLPDSLTYEALISCLCENLLLEDAVDLIEEMMENSLTPASHVFVNVVNGLCQLGKTSEAMKFLEDKHVLETCPYNVLISGCCDASKFSVAKVVLEKMCNNCIDDCDSWNILIRWLCEKAEIRKAYELVGRMVVTSWIPDCATYSALVVGNCRLSKYEDALQLFHQLRSKLQTLDSISYCELIEGLCRVEKYLEAVDVFHYMFEKQCSLESFSFDMLIAGICDRGLIAEAVKLQSLAFNSGTCCSDATCNRVMLGLCKSRKGKDLLVFLSQMLIKGCNLNAETYCILIRGMIAENQLKDSVLFFDAMINKGLLPDSDTLCDLLSYLTSYSRLYLISTSMGKLVSDSEVLDSAAYNILINGLWKEGNKSEACRLLDSMLEKGWVPDAKTHRLLIGSVDRHQTDKEMFTFGQHMIKDDVSDILAEGLEKT